MSRRLLLALAACALVAASGIGVGFSGAFFRDTDTTPQPVSADAPSHWLHLYSSASDPLHHTGFATRADASDPAATGADETLAIDAGHRATTGPWPAFDRAFVIAAPDPLPQGATSVTVTATPSNPAAHPSQPLQDVTITALDGSALTSPVTLAAGDERQVNFKVDTAGLGAATAYHAAIELRLDFADGSFLHYRVPVDVCTAIGAPCS